MYKRGTYVRRVNSPIGYEVDRIALYFTLKPSLSLLESESKVDVYARTAEVRTKQHQERHGTRTSGFPLVFVHLALAIGINDLHVLQERLEILMLAILREHLVEFLHVREFKTVFARKPAPTA